jgi:hypothetical protein
MSRASGDEGNVHFPDRYGVVDNVENICGNINSFPGEKPVA